MKRRNIHFLIVALICRWSVNAQAQDRIQSFVDGNGKTVFTNMLENPAPAPAELGQSDTTAAVQTPAAGGMFQPLVESISRTHGVDPALVVAMMKTESNFNRWAVSSKGALGLMQLIPETGRRFGVRDFFDPRQNIEGGVRYLRFLLDKFKGNVELSLAAYNAGENLVQRLGRVPPIPETQDYVRKIRKIYKSNDAVGERSPESQEASAEPAPATPVIYRTVDARGVVHFSNIEK